MKSRMPERARTDPWEPQGSNPLGPPGPESPSATPGDELTLKLPSPRYAAVIAWLPTVSVLVENVAVPPLRVPAPIMFEPSKKSTEPVGVPAPGLFTLTVAVKVT